MALIGVSYGGESIARWLDSQPEAIDCVEIAAEDFYRQNLQSLASLTRLRPLVVRAASLPLGTPGRLQHDRLAWLADVVAVANPSHLIHPLGCSHAGGINLRRPVAISLNPGSLAAAADQVAELMQACGKTVLVQNITAPLRVPGTIVETEFLNRLCEAANCGLLVDVTALLVASRNQRFDPLSWLGDLDEAWIAGGHIAGCTFRDDRWQDAHQGPVDEEAWGLIEILVQRGRPELLVLETQGPSERVDRLERDLRRLRTIASNEVDLSTQPTKSTAGEPPAVQRASATRRSADATHAVDSPRQLSRARSRQLFQVMKSNVALESRSDRVDIAADAVLFVLDHAGVFFSESRQEVYLFNTAATFVWCLAEQGLSANAIIDAYQEAFSLSRSDATQHVTSILQQWFGLGYIREPVLPAAPEVELATALAWLLTNPALRDQFRDSPPRLATTLRIDAADVDSFVSLNPDELDTQAEEIAELRAFSRYRGGVRATSVLGATTIAVDPDLLETALRMRARHTQSAPVRCYRLLTTTFCIRVQSERLNEDVHAALAHLQVAAYAPDAMLDVRHADAGWIVFDGATPMKYCRREDEIVPAVKQLLRESAVNRCRFLIKIHAAVVLLDTGCVLLPGAPGSGKTTLTAALLRAGGKYFSDEVALLEEGTLGVRPVPLALTLKAGSVEPLRRLYPELAELPLHMREDHQGVRYLLPPSESLFDDGQAHQVRWIVFPRYDPTVKSSLRPLDRPNGLRRLLDESLVLPDLLDRNKVETVVRWMREVQCFELPMSSLETGVALVQSLDSTG